MRLALPGSLLVHASALGLMLVGFNWPKADDAAAPAPVTVNIVPMSSVSSNATEIVQTDSTVSAVSAGNAQTTIESETPETIEPIRDVVEPERPEPVEPVQAEAVEADDMRAEALPEPAEALDREVAPALELAELSSTAISPVTAVPVAPSTPTETATAVEAQPERPIETASAPAIEPISAEDISNAPVPHILNRPRPAEPIVHKPQPPRPQQTQPKQTAGNGGNSQADSVAAAGGAQPQVSNQGSGGNAEIARYPGQVTNKLRRALRRGGGQSGQVTVRFTVLANGHVSGVGIAISSGNAATDQAGLALVQRAAPFPPIPPGAGRSEWVFDVPLAF